MITQCSRLEASLDYTDATRRRLLHAILHAALEPGEDVMPAEARVAAHG